MTPPERPRHLRAATRVSVAAVVWGLVTGTLSLVAGARSGSLGLLGTGCDVLADVVGSTALIWRFRAEERGTASPVALERRAQIITAAGLLVVAVGLAVTGCLRLASGSGATVDALSVTTAALSLVGLPVLAIVKYRVAAELASGALRTDAHTSAIGAATAAATLLGLGATRAFGWTSADALAGLVIAAMAAAAGIAGLRSLLTPV